MSLEYISSPGSVSPVPAVGGGWPMPWRGRDLGTVGGYTPPDGGDHDGQGGEDQKQLEYG
ncbi:hypothetical protein [Nocardia huaxiensis]|uniref:hypothetical protein n=1 Tax=Nocardia huaxiensis TaxID=2755382 RepID=UPI001E424B56|nr:hypothetical protein [Nocardia huaxiensis]UFS98393.1 hypothetical protein LPY97_11075 [Nocardia huaxiensis]